MWKIAIDIGSSMTKIYRADTGSGIVLAEPSCVAVSGESNEVKAVGKEAKSLIGKTAELTNIIYPVYEGEVVHLELASAMLKEFFARIGVKPSTLRRSQVLIGVPCGIRKEALEQYALLAEECGLKRAVFVEQPYLQAVGAGARLSEADSAFCIDIGGGITNIAVLSADGIIAGASMNIGGNNIDETIRWRVERANGLRIGALTAERLKMEIGSLLQNARGAFVAEGSSVDTLRPASSSVQTSEIRDCIRVYVDKIIEYAGDVLRTLPAEVSANVHRNGVFLSGGMMKLPGLPQYIGAKLEMRYHLCEEPQFATVLGGGAVVQDKVLLAQLGKETE